MRIIFNKYPIDMILCMSCSVVIIPLVLCNTTGILRIALGVPFILFIPGYVLLFALLPMKKTEKGLECTERAILSMGTSVAVVTLMGIGLNYTTEGIQLESMLLSLFSFILGVGVIAIYRWVKTPRDKRLIISLNLPSTRSENKLDKALTLLLIAVLLVTATLLVYTTVSTKPGEAFTNFYLLGPAGTASGYPRNLSVGEDAEVIIGITNHEHQPFHYTIELWLINQSMVANQTIYHNMWFVDNIEVDLNHTPLTVEDSWTPQWEYPYTFNLSKKGENLKLAFLLFTKHTGTYAVNHDYNELAEEKLNTAYRVLSLWITVT